MTLWGRPGEGEDTEGPKMKATDELAYLPGDIIVMGYSSLRRSGKGSSVIFTTKWDIIAFKENRNSYQRKSSYGTLQYLRDHYEINAEHWSDQHSGITSGAGQVSGREVSALGGARGKLGTAKSSSSYSSHTGVYECNIENV